MHKVGGATVPFSPIPLPDPSAFEDKVIFKKQKRSLLDTPLGDTSYYSSATASSSSYPHFSTPYPKCPSTPCRASPYKTRTAEKQLCFTELKRPRCSSSNFEYIAPLGEGSFGVVYKARCLEDSKSYAIKKSKKPIWNTTFRSQHLTEIVAAQSLGFHRNLAQIHDAWEEGGHIYIQMELCDRSLKDVLNSHEDGVVSEHLIWKYLADVVQGLHHVHKHTLVHLDLKPENMLLGVDGALKIADLGNAVRIGATPLVSTRNNPVEGDKIYMAPELLDEQFTLAADIFSVGITMFEMATGVDLPGSGQWWRNLRSGEHEILDKFFDEAPQVVPLSSSLRDVIKSMMDPNPTRRPTTQALLDVPDVSAHSLASNADVQPTRKFKITRKLFQA